MSRHVSNRSRTSLSRGSVMDVQPRRPQQAVVPESPAVTKEPQPAAPATVQARPQSPAIQELQPVATTPVPEVPAADAPIPDLPQQSEAAPAQELRKGLSPELLAQAESEAQKQEQDKQKLLAARAKNKRKGPIIASVIAIIAALSLIGTAVYAYLDSQKKPADTNQAQRDMPSEQAIDAQGAAAASSEIEAVEKELDAAINATDETQEIPQDGLDEESLGL